MKLDTLDIRILGLLQISSMLTPKLSEIAKEIGTTNATVYRRIEALKKEGVIVGHTTRIDSKLIGKSFQVILYLRLPKTLTPDEKAKHSHKLAEMDAIESVYEPIGKWSYIIKSSHGDMEELNTFIKEGLSKIPYEEMQMELILNVVKEGRISLPKLSL